MKLFQEFQLPDFKIVDMHLHLPVKQDDWLAPWRERYIERNGVERWNEFKSLQNAQKSWLSEYGFPQPDKPFDSVEDAADCWAEECRRHSLERVVFLTGGGNALLSRAVERYPTLFSGFANHDPECEDAAEKLENAIKYQGLCGYKILAPLIQTPLDDPRFDEVFEVCNQNELPVLIHFGILGGGGGIAGSVNQSPLSIANTAIRFPRARFIVPHFGCGYTNELLTLCWACPNVYVDTSGNNLWTKWTMENYTLEQLFSRFYATIGAKRIVFGSDSEWFPRGFALRYLLDQLRAVQAINMPAGDIRKIFRENALEILKIKVEG